MKRTLFLTVSLVFVLCCIFALTANAQCAGGCTDSWTITEGENSYLDQATATNRCSVCGTVIAEETINPLFITAGYSYNEFNGGFAQQFAADRDAIARYTEITGSTVSFGAIIFAADYVGEATPLVFEDGNLTAASGVYFVDFTKSEFALFDVMINGIPEDARDDAYIVCGAFVAIDGDITYIDNGRVATKCVAYTYNDVVKAVDSWGEEEETVKSFKVLTIGNSFSDDAMEYVYKIAKEAGIEHVEVGNLRANSCSLATHVSNAQGNKGVYMFRYWADGATTWADTGTWNGGPYTIKEAVQYTDWDYIVFQQVSSDSGNASTYDSLNTLISYVEELNPNAKFAWHMTWPMRSDYASSGPSYNAIVKAVNEKITSNQKIEVIIPTGTAIQNAKTSYLTDTQLQRDAKHLSYGMGRYVAALTFVKALTGVSIDNSTYPITDTEGHSTTSGNDNCKASFKFTDEINAICIESANNAIENPFEITNSQYTTK